MLFRSLKYSKPAIQLTKTLVGVQPKDRCLLPYFPEQHLANWLATQGEEPITIWCFSKTGLMPLIHNYRLLTEHLGIDAILLIDGGVDGLIHGDEAQIGTPVEDALSLSAVNSLQNVPLRLLCCLGLGAETEISHTQILENISNLCSTNDFLGSCSLTKSMPCFQLYEIGRAHV